MKDTLRTICFSASLLGCSPGLFAGVSENSNGVSIVNTVEECIAFSSKNIEKTPYGMVLHARAEFKKSVAECGCTSLLLSYSVSEKIKIAGEEVEYERLYARKIAPGAGADDFPFVISTDPGLLYRGEISLEVNCNSPD